MTDGSRSVCSGVGGLIYDRDETDSLKWVGIQRRARGGEHVRFARTQCGRELGNCLTRAKTTQPVPEPCGRFFGSGPLPTVLAKASGVSLRFRGIYFGILGILGWISH